jgi:hypothetical protein
VSKWTTYGEPSLSTTGRTLVWPVRTLEGALLGSVKWYGRWRKYAFFPEAGTVFETGCLRDIAGFCEVETMKQRNNRGGPMKK